MYPVHVFHQDESLEDSQAEIEKGADKEQGKKRRAKPASEEHGKSKSHKTSDKESRRSGEKSRRSSSAKVSLIFFSCCSGFVSKI